MEEEVLVATQSPMESLGVAYQKLLSSLIEKENWERSEYVQLCSDLKLMPDGAMEAINEWAYNQTNAPIIDDGDPVNIDINIYNEIING